MISILRAPLLASLLLVPAAAAQDGTAAVNPAPTQDPEPQPQDPPTIDADDQPADTDVTGWQVWWNYNRDPYLDLRSTVREVSKSSVTGWEDYFLGLGQTPSEAVSLRPPLVALRESVVPALFEVLENETDIDLLGGALIALGKIGEEGRPAGDPKTLATRIQEFVGHSSQDVAESAVIALGALGSFESAPPLSALVKDDATGRKLVDGDRVPTRLRSFAAYGLGLIGARTHMSDVKQFVALELFSALDGIDRDKENTYDLETACIISLGLVRLPLRVVDPLEPQEELPEGEAPHNSRRAQIAALLSRLENSRKTELIRAHLPVALARLSHDADLGTKRVVARELLDYLKKGKRTPLILEQGCVTALGILGDDDKDETDVAIRSTLLRLAKKADRSTRRLALISLAQVGARQGEGERDQAFEEVRSFLLEELEKGSTQLRPWAGLALGVLEHRRALAGQSISTETKKALTQALEESSSPDEASALCVALGLSQTIEAQDLLLKRTSQAQDDVVRGFACVGLGLMGARATIPRLREVAANSLRRPRLLRDAATALALLGDKNAVPELTGELRESRTLAVGGAVATALSLVGDVRALRPLIEIVRGEGQPAPGTKERAFAAIALGGICDKESLPFQSKISLDVNYWLPPSTLTRRDTASGILDLL